MWEGSGGGGGGGLQGCILCLSRDTHLHRALPVEIKMYTCVGFINTCI